MPRESRWRLLLWSTLLRGLRWRLAKAVVCMLLKGIAPAFASVGHAARRIALAFGKSGNLRAAKGIALAFASVGHVAVLPVHFFLSLFNLLCCGGAFACGVDEVFRYNGPHD